MKAKILQLIAIIMLCVIMGDLGYSQASSVLKQMDNSNWDDQFDTQGLNGSVTALDVYGGNVYVGGTFTDAGGVAVNRIARWDGSSWNPLGSGVNGRVREIVVNLNKVYAGGSFTTAGGVAASHIAVWNGSSWSALGSGVDGDVYAIAVKGNEVYVGGDFQHAGGITVNNIAVFNTESQIWSDLNNGVVYSNNYRLTPGVNTGWEEAIVYDILVRGSNVFVGGGFNKAGSDSAYKVAYWDGSSWNNMDGGILYWDFYPPVKVLSLATDWDHIYVGTSNEFNPGREFMNSDFEGYYIEYAYLYTWSGGIGWRTPYEAYFGYAEVPQISAMDYSTGILFAGGQFSPESISLGDWPDYFSTRYPDLKGNNIVLWDGSDWDSLGSGTNGPVYEIVARPGEVWVGGDFSKAGNKASHNIAHYVFDSFPDLTCIYVPGDYPTIQEAIDAATDNDTIMVAPGTYDIDAAIINDRVNNLKIYGSRQEDGSDASIIDASAHPGEHFCFSFQNVTGGEISGFEIKNGVVGVFYDNCMNCKCSHNYIHHQHTINGPDIPCGISICRSTEIEIEFCILDSNQVKGIDMWQGENITIINNTIVNNGDKCGCWINNSDSITVKNNILAYNDTDGIGIKNCTFTEFIHDYNCFWQNTTDPIQGYTPGTHSLESDPLFVDLTQSDYYLQTGSPCLGAGEGGVDIGALGETIPEIVIYQDDFNDNLLSDTTWQVMETVGTQVVEQNQRLEMGTTVIANAQVNSRFMLQGDFDLRIDFKVCPNEVNGNGLGITVFDEDNGYSINRLYDDGWSTSDGKNGHMYMSNFDGDYSSEGRLSTPADDTTGTLRLVRTGSTITSYFQRDNQWIELKSKTGSTEDLYLSIYVMVYGTLMPLQGWADNFIITEGTLTWPEEVIAFSCGESVADADIYIEQEPDGILVSGSRTTTNSSGIFTLEGSFNTVGKYSINIAIPDSVADRLGIIIPDHKGGFAIGILSPAKMLFKQRVTTENGVIVDFYSPGTKAIPNTGDIQLEVGSINVEASANLPYTWNYSGFLSYFQPKTVQARYISASSGTVVTDTVSWGDTLDVTIIKGDSIMVTTTMEVSEDAEMKHTLIHTTQQNKEGTGSNLQFVPQDSGVYIVSYKVTGARDSYQPFKVYFNVIPSDSTGIHIEDKDLSIPEKFTLLQNYPNPFNPETTIQFGLPEETKVTITIYDTRGSIVETLVSKKMCAGIHIVIWNAGRYPSGIYFYKVETKNFQGVKKCILLK